MLCATADAQVALGKGATRWGRRVSNLGSRSWWKLCSKWTVQYSGGEFIVLSSLENPTNKQTTGGKDRLRQSATGWKLENSENCSDRLSRRNTEKRAYRNRLIVLSRGERDTKRKTKPPTRTVQGTSVWWCILPITDHRYRAEIVCVCFLVWGGICLAFCVTTILATERYQTQPNSIVEIIIYMHEHHTHKHALVHIHVQTWPILRVHLIGIWWHTERTNRIKFCIS